MSGTAWSAARGARTRRTAIDPYRPIAGSLQLPSAHIEIIDQSHERCAALGLSRIERPDHDPLGRSDLTLARERNLRLYSHAAPVMEMLHEQIVNSHSMVVLCDAAGTIIHSIGDDDFLAKASKVALQPGVNWSEPAKGTNAVGTALVAELPTLVHADEHFMHANHFLTCSAAPILDPRGNILGALDVSGEHPSYHPHTMALVKMSARMIENHWLSDDLRHVMRLHFHGRVEFLGTLMEGILAVNPDGRIVGANRAALDQLGLSGAALRMQSLASLFGTTVGTLVDRFRSPLATPLSLQTQGGQALHVLARFNWPVWHSIEEAAGSNVRGAAAARPFVPAVPVLAAPAPPGLALLASGDAPLAALVAKIRRVLDCDIPILISGETGTGKALLARAIHQDSRRAHQAFVAVNCAAFAAAPVESELFGKISAAHGGTLFLDRIDELPLPLQGQLLRVLQERQLTPPGGGQPLALDLAIICATQRDLRELIAAQQFRDDLYYRLNGLAVRLPPLRERSDLLALAERFVERESGARPLQIAADVRALLRGHVWPGNVRELFNVLRSACLMAAGETVIGREHLPDDFLADAQAPLAPAQAAPDPAAAAAMPEARSLDAIEIDAIQRALDAAAGNISEAAKRLGISRNTIYRKLRWNVARS